MPSFPAFLTDSAGLTELAGCADATAASLSCNKEAGPRSRFFALILIGRKELLGASGAPLGPGCDTREHVVTKILQDLCFKFTDFETKAYSLAFLGNMGAWLYPQRKEAIMGIKAAEALEITFEEMPNYLHKNHSVYMEVAGATYYLTDANDIYWRAQRTDQLNEKGHYIDASELVPTVSEFMDLPFLDGKSLTDLFPDAVFYASVKE